jgi:hypothetical protein
MKILSRLLLAAFAFSLSSLAAQADVVYDYTGLDYTVAFGSYTTSESVTGTFTLAAPLADNLNDAIISPVSFSISDGLQTITNANAATSAFTFSTDATGNLTNWVITLTTSNTGGGAIDIDGPGSGTPGDQVEYQNNSPNSSFAESIGSGTFTEVAPTPSPVPEPQSWALMLTGLALLLALRFSTRAHQQRLVRSA